MIWRWLICFSLTGFLSSSPCMQAATVSGRIEITGVHRPGRSSENESPVVIWLEPTGNRINRATASHARMIQRNKHFVPHVLPVEVGTVVDFPNLDPIFHNAFSNFDGQIFDIGLYPPGTSRSVSFRRTGIVRVFCNIHSTMSAVIVVVGTPYFVLADAEGNLMMSNVPPGEYTLHVFDERATPETLSALSRTVAVSGSDLNLDTISIPETAYIPLDHKNKYGLDYPPEPADYSVQP
jgi:plastocyanin